MTDRYPTIQEIQQSVEYRWRMKQTKTILLVCLLIFLVDMIPVIIALLFRDGFHLHKLKIYLLYMAGVLLIFLLSPLAILALYFYGKARHLLRNRDCLIPCAVLLNHPVLAFSRWNGSVYYYKVNVFYNDDMISARTNTLFTDKDLKNYNDFSVAALYDPKTNLVYILQKQ